MKKYVIGIDLGTTNSVLAYAPIDAETAEVRLLDVPQIVAPATIESRPSLASFVYLPTEAELGDDSLKLPWETNQTEIGVAGEIARKRSAELPDRTVSAAKSWLCHNKVDRREPILPWGAPADFPKISPLTASKLYLEHLIAAWEQKFPDCPVSEQQVVLTVPASFDASARELTREAAVAAGISAENLLFLEEPQAAIYAWLGEVGDEWRKSLKLGDVLLVVDVGGGTTDLTLICVEEEDGELVLKRLAVGDHLLVGGDNMDLALAYYVAELLNEKGHKLDPWQSVSLWHSCRTAKETLLSETDNGKDNYTISVLGRGSRLIGGTISVEVEKSKAASLLGDGFFPVCERSDRPQRRTISGFKELGLPYEQDTAISRHLASFLAAHDASPTHVLLNGGVFKSKSLSERLFDSFGKWFPQNVPESLSAIDLDHSVARGAAQYGWAKETGGVRIRGGTARSYYIGIETAGLAIPGAPRPLKALCVAPIGMEEGTETDVPSEEIGLVVGQTAHFRVFSSTTRKQDQPGDLFDVNSAGEELAETDSMETMLPKEDSNEDYVPVRFHTQVTELGVMELWCNSSSEDKRWKLEWGSRE